MATFSSWNVEETKKAQFGVNRQHGFGFLIQNSQGVPLITFSYATEEESKKAEILIRQAVANAKDIFKW